MGRFVLGKKSKNVPVDLSLLLAGLSEHKPKVQKTREQERAEERAVQKELDEQVRVEQEAAKKHQEEADFSATDGAESFDTGEADYTGSPEEGQCWTGESGWTTVKRSAYPTRTPKGVKA
jgi:hypothetical protein